MARIALLVTVLVALLALPAAALGATASVVDGQLRYVAADGERNNNQLLLVDDGSRYRLAAQGTTAGPGCVLDGGWVYCPSAGVTSIAIALGDRDDHFLFGELGAPMTLSGGPGLDGLRYFLPEERPLTITADGQPGDGPEGRDNIAPDVEIVGGGPFADTLQNGVGGGSVGGGLGDDRLMGNVGNDVIHGAYVESVGLDSGDFYANGTDTISCGGGRDFVYADETDSIAGDCEAVGRRRPGKAFLFTGSAVADRISVPYGWTPAHVFGGGGADLLITSFAGATRIVGGSGNDRIDGGIDHGPGQRLEGNSGNDRIRARETREPARDFVICGSGRDTAIVDRLDRVSGCERVLRSR
jgi:hypothetical protein